MRKNRVLVITAVILGSGVLGLSACATTTTTVVRARAPKPAVTKTVTAKPVPVVGNPCNFASGYQLGDCNPTGETEQQYIDHPGGPAPGTSTNARGCYYVKMGEGYCPSTGTYIPMQDPSR